MGYKIRYALRGTELGPPIEKPNAHEAAQQILYLERDGYASLGIIDPQGNEIDREQLDKLALQSFSARRNI
jgi:hypothetical protein